MAHVPIGVKNRLIPPKEITNEIMKESTGFSIMLWTIILTLTSIDIPYDKYTNAIWHY